MERATKRRSDEATKGWRVWRLFPPSLRRFVAPSLILLSISCSNNQNGPTTRPLSMEEKQAQMMNDPFGYKTDTPNTDISGGDLTNFDRDAFKKDVDHVFNP